MHKICMTQPPGYSTNVTKLTFENSNIKDRTEERVRIRGCGCLSMNLFVSSQISQSRRKFVTVIFDIIFLKIHLKSDLGKLCACYGTLK